MASRLAIAIFDSALEVAGLEQRTDALAIVAGNDLERPPPPERAIVWRAAVCGLCLWN